MIDNAIILAAGMGKRLKPITDHAPKCLTEVNSTPILINTLNNLIYCGINKCTIVTGYFYDAIKKRIGSNYKEMTINYIYNDIYEKTNDMYSLWLARETLKKGSIVLEGDIFFRVEILKNAMVKMGNKSYYIAGSYNGIENEILISTDSNQRIKSVDVLNDCKGEVNKLNYMSSGVLVTQQDYGKMFSEWLTLFVKEQKTNILFDTVISKHVKDLPLHVYEINHNDWVEIDTKEDLLKAEKIFK